MLLSHTEPFRCGEWCISSSPSSVPHSCLSKPGNPWIGRVSSTSRSNSPGRQSEGADATVDLGPISKDPRESPLRPRTVSHSAQAICNPILGHFCERHNCLRQLRREAPQNFPRSDLGTDVIRHALIAPSVVWRGADSWEAGS
jgi:hypothetical protein